MNIQEQITGLLNSNNYDIRISGNARFMDQKVTPDVISIIADCVINYLGENQDNEFTSRNIWDSNYTKENIYNIFSKPGVQNQSANNEYDKFFQQPLKMLSYAGVLRETKRGTRCFYTIENFEILKYISYRERNSLNFLQLYLEKVLTDSNIISYFQNFLTRQDRNSFSNLKSNYENFIIENTPITGVVECRRIFTKIINPMSYKFHKKGTKRGNLSRDIISYDELMYNRVNWRDITKLRGETREEFENRAKQKINSFSNYSKVKAKKLIKEYYNNISEFSPDNNSISTEVHHIFMSIEFPRIKASPENLILLTSDEHRGQAHNRSNFQSISSEFQYQYLIIKLRNIERSINDRGEIIYSKESYSNVLNEGFRSSEFKEDLSFEQIRQKIDEIHQH